MCMCVWVCACLCTAVCCCVPACMHACVRACGPVRRCTTTSTACCCWRAGGYIGWRTSGGSNPAHLSISTPNHIVMAVRGAGGKRRGWRVEFSIALQTHVCPAVHNRGVGHPVSSYSISLICAGLSLYLSSRCLPRTLYPLPLQSHSLQVSCPGWRCDLDGALRLAVVRRAVQMPRGMLFTYPSMFPFRARSMNKVHRKRAVGH